MPTLLVAAFKDADGSRTHFKPLCRRSPCRLAPASKLISVSSPGVEPGPRPSQGRMLIRHTPRTISPKYLARESNPVLQFRRLPCFPHTRKANEPVSRPGVEPGPGASEAPMRSATPSGQTSCQSCRADDWIRTSMYLFTRQAPFSVEPRRHCAAIAAAQA